MRQVESPNVSIRLPKTQRSYWLDSAPATSYPPLKGSVRCDVVIVGGGIAGITAAYKLKAAGLKVVVLEINTIGSGTTGGTTGKVTMQHGLIYGELTERFGIIFAKQYASMCHRAFDDIQDLVAHEKIDCDWHVADNYVYTTKAKTVESLKEEADIAAGLALPASYETNLQLPFDVKGAVKFADQAYFNAVKYVRALARLVDGGGSNVFEQSEAVKIHEGKPCVVKTRDGEVIADNMIIATKVPAAPLVGRLTYATREYPTTSYIVAGKYTGNLKGMYISPDKSHYSLLPIDTPGGKLLLIGGESHLPGIRRSLPRQRKLADYALKWFGITDIIFRWKAMDYLGYDSLPLVGKLYPWSKHAYMIGGFKKWGLNLSMVAANILEERIAGKNPNALEFFSPQRLSAPVSIPKAVIKYFQ